MSIQKLRHKDKLVFSIKLDESIETNRMEIPPMMGQPFVENSIGCKTE